MTLMQGIGKPGLRSFLVVVLLLTSGAIERAYAQSNAAAVSAQGGPTTDQLFEEAVDKSDEFEAFGWPARGRFTLTPRLNKEYVEFNRRLWNKVNGCLPAGARAISECVFHI